MKKTLNCVAVCLIAKASIAVGSIQGMVTIKDRKGIKVDNCEGAVAFVEGSNLKSTPMTSAKMDLKNRRFLPNLMPITVGTKVEFPNKDTILHNVFSLSKTAKFDLGLYPKGKSKNVVFQKPGLVKAFCNIHSDMVGHILVLENNFFSKVSEKCEFKIPMVADGDYKVSVWYQLGKGSSIPITVSGGKVVKGAGGTGSRIAFDIVRTRNKPKRHKNKQGKSYKTKY